MGKEAKLLIVVGMKDAFTKGMSRVSRFLVGEQGKIGAAFTKTRKQVFNLRNAIVGGLAAVITKDLAKAYAQQEAAEVRLQNAMKLTGAFTEKSFQSMKDFASELQNTTTIGDETTLQMLSVAKAMRLTDDQAKDLVATSADLSAATGKDVNASFQQLLKTFGGFAGELGEVFPAMKELTAEQLKMGAGVDLARKKFKGFAEGEAKTFSGQLKQMSNLWGDLKEKMGAFVANLFDSDLGDFIKTTLVVFNDELGAVSDNLESGGSTAKRFSSVVVTGMKSVGVAVAGVVDSISLMSHGWRQFQILILEGRTLDAIQEGLDRTNVALEQHFESTGKVSQALVTQKQALLAQMQAANKQLETLRKQSKEFRNTESAGQKFAAILEEVEQRQKNNTKATQEANKEQGKQTVTVQETTTAMEEYRKEQGFVTRKLEGMKTAAATGTSELDKLHKKAEEGAAAWDNSGSGIEKLRRNLELLPVGMRQAVMAISNHQRLSKKLAETEGSAWEKYWQEQQKSINDWTDMMVAAAETVAGGVANIVGDAVGQVLQGEITTVKELGKALQEMFVDLAREIVVQMIRIAVQKAIIAAIPAAEGAVWQGGFTPIRAFAAGGVVSQPTIGIIGEAGQNEAVVPLPNGTDIPVDLRGAGGGGGQTVNINLNVQAMDGPSVLGTLSSPEAQKAIAAAVISANKKNSSFRNQMKAR